MSNLVFVSPFSTAMSQSARLGKGKSKYPKG